MAEPQPTMAGHLKHGGWGMEPFTVTVLPLSTRKQNGTLTVGVCDVCHLVIAECDHSTNKWLPEFDNEHLDEEIPEQSLICQLCGLDGT